MKHATFLIAGFILAPAVGARSQESDIQIEKLGDQSYRLVLKSVKSSSVSAAQQELIPTAKRVCGVPTIRFGKYEFAKSEPVDRANVQKTLLLLRQEIHCGDATSEPAAPTPTKPSPERRPTAELQQAIELLTRTYFGWKDERNYKQAYAMMLPTQPFEQWQLVAEKFNSAAGANRSRTIKRSPGTKTRLRVLDPVSMRPWYSLASSRISIPIADTLSSTKARAVHFCSYEKKRISFPKSWNGNFSQVILQPHGPNWDVKVSRCRYRQ